MAEWARTMRREGSEPVAASDAALAALEGGGDVDADIDNGTALLGKLIDGRYQLEAVLGRGGMGLVYRASHVGLRRYVAVKILHPSLIASSDVRNRFEREGYAVGRIKHPNCVEVYDRGRLADGSLYLAMELLEGRPLAEVLEREGQLAPGRALHILAHILRGLGHVHEAGLIHRDIKPENIFLIRQGSDVDFAKILDFGIAKPMEKTSLDDGVKLTQAGMAFGTPVYMAPEQALGNPLDGRADLYAAAVLAYEMLTGQPPFYSDDKLEVMSMHTARPVPAMRTRLAKHARGVPSSIERLIAKGLTKKPSDRYASAEVFLAAVEHALRTPDGGVTDIEIDRERVDTTGSQPLVGADGEVSLADSIEDAIATSAPAIRMPTPPVATRVPTPPPSTVVPTLAEALGGPLVFGAPPQSGIGIGIPYTGPTGEPIFGLTPEQRLASATAQRMPGDGAPRQVAASAHEANASIAGVLEPDATARTPKRGRRVLVYAGIAAVAIAIGVVVAVVTHARDSAVAPTGVAGQALAALATGDHEQALAILNAHPDAIAQDPQGQLVLGHVQSARNDVTAAVAAYARAMTLDRTVETDPRLRRSLSAMSAARAVDPAMAALDLWMRTGDDAARIALGKEAAAGEIVRRHAFRALVDKYQLAARVDWVQSYGYDLQQEATCALRKAAVVRLRALDDPRAIALLQQALARKGKTGTHQSVNACLSDDAQAAIGYLNTLPGKPAPAPAPTAP